MKNILSVSLLAFTGIVVKLVLLPLFLLRKRSDALHEINRRLDSIGSM